MLFFKIKKKRSYFIFCLDFSDYLCLEKTLYWWTK